MPKTITGSIGIFFSKTVGRCGRESFACGGVKVIRVLFGYKYLRREITQIIHHQAVLPIKIDRKTLAGDVQRQILGFLLFYIALMTASALIVTAIEGDAAIGLVGTAATIGNIGPGFGEIGPGFGEIGPMGAFADCRWQPKLFLSLI